MRSAERDYRRERKGDEEGRQESPAASQGGNRVPVSGRDTPYYKFDSTGVTALGGPGL